MQVQDNVQTVLEALGLVDNKNAANEAKALQEVSNESLLLAGLAAVLRVQAYPACYCMVMPGQASCCGIIA